MNLYLLRTMYTRDVCTIGLMLHSNMVFGYTLEDITRPANSPKVHGMTAIPAGKYQVIVSMSERFKRETPLLLNVPGFSGIRIHGGNTAEDTMGCILIARNLVNGYTIQGSLEKELTVLLKSTPESHYIEVLNTTHT